jgi:hypothetical protein
MLADYVTLADGRKVRIEINLDTMIAWQRDTGQDLPEIDNVYKNASLLKALAYAGAQVGEQLDGRVLELTADEFSSLCRVNQVLQFVQAIKNQSVQVEKKKDPRGKRGGVK